MRTKQVIVVRKDLNMRKGKIGAQVAHAAMSFLTKNMKPTVRYPELGNPYYANPMLVVLPNFYESTAWLDDSFRKIVVSVNSEEELLKIHRLALEQGLISHLITDNGATEFNGVPTKTCLAVGPHNEEKFVGLTDHLPLL